MFGSLRPRVAASLVLAAIVLPLHHGLASSGSVGALWRIDVKSGERKLVSPQEDHAYWGNARYSRDGKIVFAVSTKGNGVGRIWRSSATSGWTAVTPERDEISEFDLSPDGRMIAMIVDRGDTDELRVIDVMRDIKKVEHPNAIALRKKSTRMEDCSAMKPPATTSTMPVMSAARP